MVLSINKWEIFLQLFHANFAIRECYLGEKSKGTIFFINEENLSFLKREDRPEIQSSFKMKIMQPLWPVLSYKTGKDTFETIHMWMQIVGKIKLATLPWVNHSWHVTLHITSNGITTQTIPFENKTLE